MFVRRNAKLPEDPKFPIDLKGLGYFITPAGQVLNAGASSEHFKFRITNSSRYNEVHREAFNACLRYEVIRRLEGLGLRRLFLPNLKPGAPAPPAASLSILTTPAVLLRQKRRVVVVVNNSQEDLGILSWRALARSGGLKNGSMIDFINGLQLRAYNAADAKGADRESETPGVVILNTGQLLFSHKQRAAMTRVSWLSSPRPSAVHPPPKIHEVYNRIAGNKTIDEHVDFVFRGILGNRDYVRQDADLYIVGIADGGDAVIKYLEGNGHSHRVAALAVTAPVPVLPTTAVIKLNEQNKSLLNLLNERTVAWCVSHHPLNTPLANPTPVDDIIQAGSEESIAQGTEASMQEIALFPMVSGGEAQFPEAVMPAAADSILDWFDSVARAGGSAYYRIPRMEVSQEMQETTLNLTKPEPVNWGEE